MVLNLQYIYYKYEIMFKLICTLSLFLATFIGAANIYSQNGPIMTFEKSEIDYGNIIQGSDGFRFFKFKNTGNQTLIIKQATGSCGCTVPKWPSEPIKPGHTGVLEVKYETSRLGFFSKTVTVETNEVSGGHKLTIKGNVLDKNTAAGLTQQLGSN